MKNHVYPPLMLGAYRPPRAELMNSPADADAAFALFSGAGLNMFTDWLDPASEKTGWIIDACEKYGVKFLPVLPSSGAEEFAARLMKSPCFMGFNMQDEPPATRFSELAAERDAARPFVGDRILMLNLFPHSVGPKGLGVDPSFEEQYRVPGDPYEKCYTNGAYREYVRQFLDVYRSDVLCYDFYAITQESERDPEVRRRLHYGLIKNHSLFAAESAERGLPFWSILQAWAYNEKIAPELRHFRWQLGINYAFGAEALIYFVYQNSYEENTGPELWRDAPLTKAGQITPTYYELKKANEEFRRYYPAMIGWTNLGVLLVNPEPYITFAADRRTVLDGFAPVERIESDIPLIIGCCEKAGRRALFAASAVYDCAGSAEITLRDGVCAALHSKDGASSQSGKTLRLSFAQGENMFIEL